MAYELRDNSGSLFKNDKREKDTHPHATGKAMIGGKVYWVSAWTKDGKSGKFQSLAFKEVETAKAAAKPVPAAADFKDDEIPDFGGKDDSCPF